MIPLAHQDTIRFCPPRIAGGLGAIVHDALGGEAGGGAEWRRLWFSRMGRLRRPIRGRPQTVSGDGMVSASGGR